MKQVQVTPMYVQNFSCIADRCEDHCCHGWSITIDKSNYRFMTEKSSLKHKAQKVMVKTPRLASFAVIKLDESGVCPFRDSGGLCEVHKDHGHERLSRTCQTYPRLDVLRGDRLEHNLSLSCPEAARQILLNPQAMNFEEKKTFKPNFKPTHYSYPHYYTAVRQLFVEVLALEEVSLEARLYLLGMTFKLLDSKTDDPVAFEQMFNYCVECISNGDFLLAYNQADSMLDMHAIFLLKLYNEQLKVGISSKYQQAFARIKQVHDEMVSALSEIGNDITLQQSTLRKGFKGHYQSYFSVNPHIWVNYFLYGMYSRDFPTKGLYEIFSSLVIDFFMLRGALITIASARKIQDSDVINVTQSYHRVRSHGKKLEQRINGIIDKYLHIDPNMLPLLLLKVA